ncbi:hypothetical protein Leryth_019881 [Lithospermum erythrorhizon]|uniref:Uncharacterized protein n=1 Tax=Lithospermum erythrorhizon TaxID=34254 RepID=A0AAV3PTR8_LITER|nr:hypothetical protein Leryth_019881 [Lithospermum erythrorhizon]
MSQTLSGATTPTTVKSVFHSPTPYLFSGLASMLILVGLALLILACTYRKSSSHQSSTGDDIDDDEEKSVNNIMKEEIEQRIVVIMAGDVMPTYLAQPISSAIILINNDEKV